MININGIPGRTAMVDGKEYLFFSGFAYLGMPSLSDFRKILNEGIEKYGAVFPSSRISNTRSSIYVRLEEKLSEYTGMNASASFSSGYMASMAAVTSASKNSTLLYYPHIHPSLKINVGRLIITGVDNWQGQMLSLVNNTPGKLFTIVMESVNPLSGEAHDFSWLQDLEQPVQVLIDDSHGIGILGKRGEGIVSDLPVSTCIQYMISYSLSKAFSCEGGAVSGGIENIEQIKKLPYFTASTAMSPAFAYTWMRSQDMFMIQREKLMKNITLFEEMIKDIPALIQHERLPVCQVKDSRLYEHCMKQLILLSAFRYPSEQDPLSARIVLNALHTMEDLERLNECIRNFYKLIK